MESSLCEKPERHAPRRLSDHLGLEGLKQKVHSLVDKVYSRTNLMLAWERVRANRGSGGTDGISIEDFETHLEINLDRLHRELRDGTYQPQPVRRIEIPKRGAPGKTRPLGIPSVYDRVCQQAMVNRLEPIFEEVFDPSSFGYRKGRKTADALSKIWREVEAGNEWIVDADLKDYFGSVDHEKLMALIGKQVADGRVLKLIQQTLTAGYPRGGSPVCNSTGNPAGRGDLAAVEQYPSHSFRQGDEAARVSPHTVGGRLGGDLSNPSRSRTCFGSGGKDSRKTRCHAQPGQDPDCARGPWVRVSGI